MSFFPPACEHGVTVDDGPCLECRQELALATEEHAKKHRPKWGEPGSKVARKTDAHVFSRGTRNVIVTVYPDGQIGLRLSKHRTEEFINAADAYRMAVSARKAAERAAKKKGGRK